MSTKQFKPFYLIILFSLLMLGVWACADAGSVDSDTATQAQTAASEETSEPAEEAEAAAEESAEVEPAVVEGQLALTIDQSQTEARFTLDEELMGAPKTVIGVTPLVEGTINIDPANLGATTISTIQIDANDLTTDSDRRNGAIRRFVLGTTDDANRYIVFEPTSITGLPEAATAGDTFELEIAGNLTVSGVTNPVTFVTSITVDSDTQVSGLATAQINRGDYNLEIPSVPSVANVSEEVLLELEFVANS